MRFDWDNHKSQLLKQNRGYSLEEIATILAGDYSSPKSFVNNKIPDFFEKSGI
jgi:uncharacterized DUF497 family protein